MAIVVSLKQFPLSSFLDFYHIMKIACSSKLASLHETQKKSSEAETP